MLVIEAKTVPSPLVHDHELSPARLTSEGKVQPEVYARFLHYVRTVLDALGAEVLIKCGLCYFVRKDIRPNEGGKHGYRYIPRRDRILWQCACKKEGAAIDDDDFTAPRCTDLSGWGRIQYGCTSYCTFSRISSERARVSSSSLPRPASTAVEAREP